MRRLLIALCAWLVAAPTFAQPTNVIGGGFYGDAKVHGGGGYTGPGDITTFTAWWGFRAYSAAAASGGSLAANIRNTSTNEQCDFGVVAAGGLGTAQNCTITSNGVSLATFCATTCAVTKMYDQVAGNACGGSSCDVVQATAANQPTIVTSCVNSLPCMNYASSASQGLQSANNMTPASGLVSFASVGEKVSGGANGFPFIREDGATNPNKFGTVAQANLWQIGGSGNFTATATDASPHSGTGVLNGASSVIAIDGTETTGTATGITTAGVITILSTTSTAANIQMSEGGFADNVAFSGTTRTNLCHNMRLYWATGGSC